MPQTYDVSAEGLRFVRVHPYAIANRFTDIQDLRRQHYGLYTSLPTGSGSFCWPFKCGFLV
jgi:hypothetical protein